MTGGATGRQSADLVAEIQAEQERDYARKVAKWERDAAQAGDGGAGDAGG